MWLCNLYVVSETASLPEGHPHQPQHQTALVVHLQVQSSAARICFQPSHFLMPLLPSRALHLPLRCRLRFQVGQLRDSSSAVEMAAPLNQHHQREKRMVVEEHPATPSLSEKLSVVVQRGWVQLAVLAGRHHHHRPPSH